MRTTHLKPTAYANRWGSIFAQSLGASIPTAILRASRVHNSPPPRLFAGGSASAHTFLSQGFPTLRDAGILPQERLAFAFWFPLWRSRKLETLHAGPEAVATEAAPPEVQVQNSGYRGDSNGATWTAPRSTNGLQKAEDLVAGNGDHRSTETAQLCFKAAAALLPHPTKIERGGEDAYFISDDGLALGIADGVGSWIEVNVDAGIYSRMLMSKAKKAAEETPAGPDAPQIVLQQAHSQTVVQGSSTACIVMLDGSTLRAVNVGDSGFLVLRNSQIVFQSPTQQHGFNFPYQLGCSEAMSDPPESSEKFSVGVKRGDVVVLATDGVIDNMYPEETASLVSTIHRRGDPPRVAASALAQYAKFRAEDKTHLSPFAYGAQKAGYRFMGGKEDDISVVVAYVTSASRL